MSARIFTRQLAANRFITDQGLVFQSSQQSPQQDDVLPIGTSPSPGSSSWNFLVKTNPRSINHIKNSFLTFHRFSPPPSGDHTTAPSNGYLTKATFSGQSKKVVTEISKPNGSTTNVKNQQLENPYKNPYSLLNATSMVCLSPLFIFRVLAANSDADAGVSCIAIHRFRVCRWMMNYNLALRMT